MSTVLRLVPTQTSERREGHMRPSCFDDFIGQTEVIANLRESVRAAKRGGWQLDHYLFAGGPGLGKTSLAAVIAAELGTRLQSTSAPAIEHKGALATLFTSLADGDILFIDEIHALDRKIAECLYSAMEDRVLYMAAGKRVINVPLPKFTVLGATTHAGTLPKPLLDRFGFVWHLRPYTVLEMQTIVMRAATKLGVDVDEGACHAIACASRGTPRIANRLLRRVRDTAVNAGADRLNDGRTGVTISSSLAIAALARLGIDQMGLDPLDRRYLALVAERSIGIEAIASALSEQRSTIEDVVEPFLVQCGFVARTARGRTLTPAGVLHIGTLSDSA